MLSVVREFLEFYNFQYTASVLASEASDVSLSRSHRTCGRSCIQPCAELK